MVEAFGSRQLHVLVVLDCIIEFNLSNSIIPLGHTFHNSRAPDKKE